MKRILFVAAVVATLLLPTAARADVVVTPSATMLSVGDTLTVTVPAATTFVQGGWIWQGTSTTGACASVRSGSYTNGGQVITYTCAGPDVLTAVAATYGTFSLPSGAITVLAPVVVTPPPAPVAHITSSYILTATTYTVTLTNDGTADWAGSWADSYQSPHAGTAVVAPAFEACGPRRILNPRTHRYTTGVGFTCTGGTLAIGASTTLTVTR